MSNWADQLVESANNKSVFINLNGVYEFPKALRMDPDWSFIDFLNAAGNRLDLVPSAKRVFNSNGVEIDDCMMIEDDDRIFVSQGEPFLQPKRKMEDPYDDSTPASSGKLSKDKNNDKKRLSTSVVGPYFVGELLGKGGFGEVREGTNQLTGEKIALKFIKKSEIQSMWAVERAANEIKCQSILRHANIIKLQMNLETRQYVVLAFELMRGGDLFKYLCNRGDTAQEASLSEEEARGVFQQVVAGVSYAHTNNIIHRDLKLENILLSEDNLNLVKVADFGLAEFYRPGGTLSSTSGTISFQAPEIFTCQNNAGPPLDIWSLGVILFALLSGRLPFEGAHISSKKKTRDAIIREKILKAQYKIDTHLSNDAKDLITVMLKSDPLTRATVPEILSHRWMRAEERRSVFTPVSFFPSAFAAAAAIIGRDKRGKGQGDTSEKSEESGKNERNEKFSAPSSSSTSVFNSKATSTFSRRGEGREGKVFPVISPAFRQADSLDSASVTNITRNISSTNLSTSHPASMPNSVSGDNLAALTAGHRESYTGGRESITGGNVGNIGNIGNRESRESRDLTSASSIIRESRENLMGLNNGYRESNGNRENMVYSAGADNPTSYFTADGEPISRYVSGLTGLRGFESRSITPTGSTTGGTYGTGGTHGTLPSGMNTSGMIGSGMSTMPVSGNVSCDDMHSLASKTNSESNMTINLSSKSNTFSLHSNSYVSNTNSNASDSFKGRIEGARERCGTPSSMLNDSSHSHMAPSTPPWLESSSTSMLSTPAMTPRLMGIGQGVQGQGGLGGLGYPTGQGQWRQGGLGGQGGQGLSPMDYLHIGQHTGLGAGQLTGQESLQAILSNISQSRSQSHSVRGNMSETHSTLSKMSQSQSISNISQSLELDGDMLSEMCRGHSASHFEATPVKVKLHQIDGDRSLSTTTSVDSIPSLLDGWARVTEEGLKAERSSSVMSNGFSDMGSDSDLETAVPLFQLVPLRRRGKILNSSFTKTYEHPSPSVTSSPEELLSINRRKRPVPVLKKAQSCSSPRTKVREAKDLKEAKDCKDNNSNKDCSHNSHNSSNKDDDKYQYDKNQLNSRRQSLVTVGTEKVPHASLRRRSVENTSQVGALRGGRGHDNGEGGQGGQGGQYSGQHGGCSESRYKREMKRELSREFKIEDELPPADVAPNVHFNPVPAVSVVPKGPSDVRKESGKGREKESEKERDKECEVSDTGVVKSTSCSASTSATSSSSAASAAIDIATALDATSSKEIHSPKDIDSEKVKHNEKDRDKAPRKVIVGCEVEESLLVGGWAAPPLYRVFSRPLP